MTTTTDPENRARRDLLLSAGLGAAALGVATLTAEAVLAQTTSEWDKTFPKSDRVDHEKVSFTNRYGISLVGDLYLPKDRDGAALPALAVAGPFGAVKEQAAGLYAQEMAERGFAALAFDPSFIGESGGNQRGMGNVATALSAEWKADAAALHIPEYYRAPPGTPNVLRELGVTNDDQPSDGLHDNPTITLNMLLDDPNSARGAARVATRQATIDGVSIADLATALERAEQIATARATRTSALIRERVAAHGQ